MVIILVLGAFCALVMLWMSAVELVRSREWQRATPEQERR